MTAIERAPSNAIAADEREFNYLMRQAQVLAKSELVPSAIRGKPESIMLIFLTGRDLGIPPTYALSQVYVIEGKPSPSAQLKLGLARAAGHDIWLEESTNERATYSGQRRGSRRVESITWTIDDARRAKLADNPKKPNWASYPAAMLRARAASNLVNVLCPEVLMGLRVETPDELGYDEDVGEGEVYEGDAIDVTSSPEVASSAREVGSVSATEEAVPTGDTEPSPSASDTPKPGAGGDEFTAEDEKFAGVAYEERFIDACDRQGWSGDQRSALVAYATGGRTGKARNVYVDTEQNALGDAYTAVLGGRLVFGHAPDGGLRMEAPDANPEGIPDGEAFSE